MPATPRRARHDRATQVAALAGLAIGATLLTAALHGADPWTGAAEADREPRPSVGAVLLVDDDENDPDVRDFYAAALEDLGTDYRVWDTGPGDIEPGPADLVPYRAVIWFTGGAATASTGPGTRAETALGAWLDRGGRLLLSSQDYNWARGGSDGFPRERLGVGRVDDDRDIHRTAAGIAPPLAGWGPWPLVFRFEDYTDVVEPSGDASTVVQSDTGAPLGIAATSGRSLAVYLGFALEAVSPPAAAADLLGRFLSWEGDRGGTTVFDDGFETGDTGRWSAVEPPPPCEIAVTEPGSGDVWQMGTTRSIRWTTVGGCDPSLRIILRRSGAAVTTIADSTPDDGLYRWTIPTDLTPAGDYRIRVREVGGAQGNSAGEFTLSAPSLTPTSPPTPSATVPPTPSATPTIGPTQPPNVMPFNR